MIWYFRTRDGCSISDLYCKNMQRGHCCFFLAMKAHYEVGFRMFIISV